ncbi:unnamed protein product [Cylicocyclus nassatus]|uniref:G domain-containing protein n=1 Tax=Cylicocyclus nassatus TaxID=53992 RepID=A0AA36GN66_CYLNA|nr:unnamed protein product [Cylicocyclus nassatus]
MPKHNGKDKCHTVKGGEEPKLGGYARRDVAIVSERAGTTRDSIEVRLNIAGVPASLTDTAGIPPALLTTGVRPLMDSLKQLVENLCPGDSGPCLTDTQLLSEAREELENAASIHDAALLCDHLERAPDIFGQMAGSTVSEEILDKMFSIINADFIDNFRLGGLNRRDAKKNSSYYVKMDHFWSEIAVVKIIYSLSATNMKIKHYIREWSLAVNTLFKEVRRLC